MKPYIIVLGMLLLLGLSSALTGALGGTGANVDAQIWARTSNNTIDASTMVFTGGQSATAVSDMKAQMSAWVTQCQAQKPDDVTGCIQEKSKALSSQASYKVTFTSLPRANYTFQYFNQYKQGGAGWSVVPGCEKVEATRQAAQSNIYDPSGNAVALYTASCTVDKNLYSGRTISVKVVPYPTDSILPAAQTVTLTDASASATAMFTSALTRMLDPNAGLLAINSATGVQTVQCMSIFIILGLLLASMYFAGKSPITLLDVTTPRLPSPKGLTASGQVIAPFGYTEMKRTVDRKIAAAVGVANATSKALPPPNVAAQKEINALAGRMGAEQGSIFKAVATSYVAKGGKLSELNKIAKPLANYTESDYAMLKQILNKIERAGGRDALLAKTIADYLQSRNLMETLDKLTFKSKPGGASEKIQTFLKRTSGVGRFAVVGPIVTGSYDAAARSMKMMAASTKASVVHGAQFVRETGKLAVQTVGGKTAMADLERKAKTSVTYATLYKQLTAKPAEIKVGDIMPVNQKMAHLYERLHAEVERDQMRYLLKQIYKKMGANVAAVTDNEVHSMMGKAVDLTGMVHYKPSGQMASVESEIHMILANSALSVSDKRGKLEELLTKIGGHADATYFNAKALSDKIAQEQAEGHTKMIMLQEMLDRENNALKAAKVGEARLDDKYYSMVGRGGLHGSDMWEVAVLRRAIYDHENGYANKNTTLKDFMVGVLLEFRNRLESLNPGSRADLLPEFMRDRSQLNKKREENTRMLSSLLTAEGEKALREMTGKTRHTATLEDYMKVLYGNEYMNLKQGFKSGGEGSGVWIDPKTKRTLWWEEDRAIGPQREWWNIDMKRHWLGGLDERGIQLTVAGGVEGRFQRGYTTPTHHGWSAEVDRYPGARTWSPEKREMETKRTWIKNMFEDNIHNTFNDRFAMNAYAGAMGETSRFYMSGAAALLAKALREAGYEERHTDLRFLETMDVTSAKDMERFRYMIGTRYKTEFEQVLKKGVSFDDIARSKHAWVMTQDGSYLPYRQGMPLSDNDRVLGGHVALRDDKGVLRRYNPDDVRVEFKGREDLAVAFNRIAGSTKKEDWAPFIASMMDWARPGGKTGSYERERILGAVLWRYSNVTYDYQSYWNKSAVTLVPRHEAMPLEPSALRFFDIQAPGLTKALKPLRDFGQLLGQWMTRTAMTGAGDLYMRSYDVNPKSQILKMQSWRLSSQILTSDFNELLKDVTSEHDRRQLAAAYRAVAMSHGAYHQVWAYTIDRNPWRTSTSHGAHQSWASVFQYGPAQTFALKANLGAYMSKAEYINFMIQGGWAASGARRAIMPYQKMIAGPQRSLQGYIGAHDWDPQNVLASYGNYTPPRLLEAFRGYNPMSFSWGGGDSWISQKLKMLNVYESRAEKAQLVGYEHQRGLLLGRTSGVAPLYKGIEYLGRTHMANPGMSYTDTRFNEQLASQMAEYAMMRMGPISGFYKNDDFVRNAAMTDTIRRTVSAEALAIKRQQELMGFGVLQNPLYCWFNPLLFPYHMGVPGYPTSMSPKELINNFIKRWRNPSGERGSLEASVKGWVRKAGEAMNRGFSPTKGSLSRFCACGRPGIIGNMCACGKRL